MNISDNKFQIGDNYGPVVHVLMKRRTTAHYDRVFEMLQEVVGETKPAQIVTDFERALRVAIKGRYPETKVSTF